MQYNAKCARSPARVTRRGRLRRKNGWSHSHLDTEENRANYPYSSLLSETVNANSTDIQSVVEGIRSKARRDADLS